MKQYQLNYLNGNIRIKNKESSLINWLMILRKLFLNLKLNYNNKLKNQSSQFLIKNYKMKN